MFSLRRSSALPFLSLCLAASAGCNDVNGFASTAPDLDAPASVTFAAAAGGQDSQTVVLGNAGGGTLVVDALVLDGASAADFSVDGADNLPVSLASGEQLLVQVVFTPDDTGSHEGILRVASNDPNEPEAEIALLTSTLAPDIDVEPSPLLSFGTVQAGQSAVLSLTLSNVGNGPLTVTGTTFGPGSSPSFQVSAPLPVTVAPGDSFDLPVTFVPGYAGGHGGTIDIASDDPDEPLVTIGLVGNGVGSAIPDISASAASVTFGQVVRFTCKSVPISVDNVGTGTLTVSAIGPVPGTSAEFAGTPASFAVTPAGSQVLSVTYCPTDTGMDAGTLQITSNDPDENPLFIQVSGEGIPPPVQNPGTDIAMQITWTTSDTDVDSHLLRPGGTFASAPGDCFYSNMNPDWGVPGDPMDDPFLDVDDVDGFGPENLNLALARTGMYSAMIYYFSDHGNGSTDVTVNLWLNGTLAYTQTRQLSHHERWHVADIDWDEVADSGNLTVVDSVVLVSPLAPQTK